MEIIKFHDGESDQELSGEVEKQGFIGEQKWLAVSAAGIDWVVPQGYPNNALPVCRESEPEAYEEIASQLK
jgi:hypothetical protein